MDVWFGLVWFRFPPPPSPAPLLPYFNCVVSGPSAFLAYHRDLTGDGALLPPVASQRDGRPSFWSS